MKIAMREPLFIEFADACLKVVHPGKVLKEGSANFRYIFGIKSKKNCNSV